MRRGRKKTTYAVVCALLLLGAGGAEGYAVLTHEAIIDAAWDQITPILLHAYTFGGCIIQDMGYYPFGSHFFSDLTHYVRSGDFVVALFRDAQNVNELAFAVGALAHYAADNTGPPVAVNRSVAIEYPKLRAKYGNEVTYADDPAAHLTTEFGFDVVEVAQGTFASEDYHDFIGFQVAKELMERAFRNTYSLELKESFTVWTWRWVPTAARLVRLFQMRRRSPGRLRRKRSSRHGLA